MKNTVKIIGIIAVIAVIVLGCKSTGPVVDVSLVNTAGEAWGFSSPMGNDGFVFSNDGTYYKVGGMGGAHWEQMSGGNYSIDGNSLTVTSEWDDPRTYTFSLSGNTLSLTYDGDTMEYTKMKIDLGGF